MKLPVNMLLVDDSQIHLEGLKAILGKNKKQIRVTGEARNTQEALRSIESDPPDVIILDISLEEEMDGIELAHELNRDYPHIHVIIMSYYKDIKHIISALEANVQAYLPKDSTPEEVINTITSVCNGKELYLGETLSKKTIQEIITTYHGKRQTPEKSKPHDLSEREIQVIAQMAKGRSSKEIAGDLFIATTTVESHKENIKRKLNLNTAIEIVVFAIVKKIIEVR